MKSYRTLTVAALALSALAAQADSQLPRDGDWSNQPVATPQAAGTTLTREAVIADLVASRQASTQPRDGEWYNVPAPLGFQSGTALARDGDPAGAMTAAKPRTRVSSDQ